MPNCHLQLSRKEDYRAPDVVLCYRPQWYWVRPAHTRFTKRLLNKTLNRKTTTMLFKMLLIERTHHLVGNSGSRPRQVFVTKSRHLATKVQDYFEKLSTSLTHASKTLEELRSLSVAPPDRDTSISLIPQEESQVRKDLPEKYSELEDKHFPLFITYDAVRSSYVSV